MTHLANDNTGRPIQSIYPGATQVLTAGASHSESNAFAAGTTVIRIVATTTPISYVIGASPVADTSQAYLPVGVVEYPQVCRGDKISVIRVGGADATVYVTKGK